MKRLFLVLAFLPAVALAREYIFDPPSNDTDGAPLEFISYYNLQCAKDPNDPFEMPVTTIGGNVMGGDVADFPLIDDGSTDSYCTVQAVQVHELIDSAGIPYTITNVSTRSNLLMIPAVVAPPKTSTPNAPTALQLVAD